MMHRVKFVAEDWIGWREKKKSNVQGTKFVKEDVSNRDWFPRTMKFGANTGAKSVYAFSCIDRHQSEERVPFSELFSWTLTRWARCTAHP